MRVYTPVGKNEQGRFGLYVAAKVLPYYKEYFGVEYPLSKMDLVVIANFAAGNFVKKPLLLSEKLKHISF